MPSNLLLNVPLELLLDIVSHLSVEDQGQLRLVCKSLEASIFDSFARRFFFEKTILQSEPSLATLLDISRSRVSAYLKRVVVQAHLIRPDRASSVLVQDENYPGSDIDLWISCLNMALLDQQTFIAMGRDIEMLGEIFANLHLDGVQIIGAPEEDPNVNSSCVAHVLYALGKAGSTPRVLEFYQESMGFQDLAFHFPDSVLDMVRPALARVESLSIDVCLYPSSQMAPLIGGQMSNLNKADALSRFLCHFKSLKSLRLDSYRCLDMGVFLMWLAAPAHLDPQQSRLPIGKSDMVKRLGQYNASEPPLRELTGPTYVTRLLQFCQPMPTVQFQHLEELELVNTCAGRQHIMQLLRKFQSSLRTLKLSSVVLFEERAPVAWPETEVKDLWSGLTRQLLSSGLSRTLGHLTVTNPYERNDQQRAMKVTFFVDGDLLEEYCCAGSHMEDGLVAMLEAIRVGEFRQGVPRAALSRGHRGTHQHRGRGRGMFRGRGGYRGRGISSGGYW